MITENTDSKGKQEGKKRGKGGERQKTRGKTNKEKGGIKDGDPKRPVAALMNSFDFQKVSLLLPYLVLQQ